MSFKFPFSTYHELNLDWILKKVETLSVNAESDANTIATYEERLQTAETQAQNAETSAANAQSAATSATAVAENALTTANSAQSSADASGALASQAATKADAAQSAAERAQQAAETAQATAANFDGRITSAEQQASEALNMAQRFDEQARAAITTANNASNVATEAQATATATSLELARQRTALETIGSQQTSAINSAGAAQVTAINNAGQAVLDSIPADYMNGVELVKDYTLGLYPQIETEYAPIRSFDNGADNIPVKELNVNIIPKQSGTGDPSPSNIRPISGWTGVNVMRTGKNLFDASILTESSAWTTIILDLPVGTWVMSTNKGAVTDTGLALYFRLTGNTNLGSNEAVINTHSAVVTISEGETAEVVFRRTTGTNLFTNYWYQLELGSTPTTYEPYTGSQISVTFPNEAGTVYGGTLTINPDRTGTLVVDREIITYNGSENWLGSSYVFGLTLQSKNFVNIIPKCDYYNGVSAREYTNLNTGECALTITYQSINFKTIYENVADFKSALNSSNVHVVLGLANPQTYQLASTEISGILTTLYGINNIWADAGNTSLIYRADLGLFITENCITNYTRFAGMIAGVETGLTASKTYNTGDYFIVGQKLYKALTNIATGATFTLGTNCEETTVGAELVLAQ